MRDEGTADTSPHYTSFPLMEQPIIQIMGAMTQDEFVGFLLGNKMKYEIRAGRKAGTNDTNKAKQYQDWHREFLIYNGITVCGTFVLRQDAQLAYLNTQGY